VSLFAKKALPFFSLAIIALLAAMPARASDNGLAKTPPMGWNSWNAFHCHVSDEMLRGMADAMVSSGMKDAGYEYIVIDDCWQVERDAAGNIVPDPKQFPNGIKPLADYVEDVPGCEVLSLGHSLEIIKDLSDAESVAERYGLAGFTGTHAIGHVRMATESDVDISGAHPYWAYPFSDIAVVHNGQLTNYHMWRRRLERKGHRFQSECDSEIIAVYLAQKMDDGLPLETAMKESLDELDGVFTYLVVTADALGVAKDEMAAKPLVLYESPGLVALASEEVAIRAVVGHEIDTYDPYEREVLVWHR